MMVITKVPGGWKYEVNEVWPKHLKIVVGESQVDMAPIEARNLARVFNGLGIIDWHGGEDEPQLGGKHGSGD